MKEYICPVCQKSFSEDSVPETCPKCGCEKELFNVIGEMSEEEEELRENVSKALEASNNYGAEHTANALAEITFIAGIIVGIIGVIAGLVMLGKDSNASLLGIPCIMFGLLFFLLCLISWAFIKLQVNISYRLTRIDNKLESKINDKQKPSKKKA